MYDYSVSHRSSVSQLPTDLDQEKTKSRSVLGSAPVHSITACAQFCTTFADCASFNLHVPVGATGNKRLCQATKYQDFEVNYNFNVYKRMTTTKIVPLVVVYKSFDVPSKDDGCSSHNAITTIVFNPNDATHSDLDHFICGKIDKPFRQSIDDGQEKKIDTIGNSAQTCADNKVLQGFDSSDEDWTGLQDMKSRCHLLEKWYVDINSCLDAFPTSNRSHYPNVFVDSDDVEDWNSWITFPYFYFGVGIKKQQIGSTNKYEILSMRCCKIIGPSYEGIFSTFFPEKVWVLMLISAFDLKQMNIIVIETFKRIKKKKPRNNHSNEMMVS
ncbi:uncharacterized protein [Palaemon carinicauda]|uniref:uncharacterized protein n=1 Tax=Palaemon carinicauda TaxID=392227 RepID=UPI0035B6A7BB